MVARVLLRSGLLLASLTIFFHYFVACFKDPGVVKPVPFGTVELVQQNVRGGGGGGGVGGVMLGTFIRLDWIGSDRIRFCFAMTTSIDLFNSDSPSGSPPPPSRP